MFKKIISNPKVIFGGIGGLLATLGTIFGIVSEIIETDPIVVPQIEEKESK